MIRVGGVGGTNFSSLPVRTKKTCVRLGTNSCAGCSLAGRRASKRAGMDDERTPSELLVREALIEGPTSTDGLRPEKKLAWSQPSKAAQVVPVPVLPLGGPRDFDQQASNEGDNARIRADSADGGQPATAR
eukprot:scaffold27721_cov36-Prasinocladus_malaysianus.AAC.1